MAWLQQAQNPTGGWGFLPGLDDDPNSTALVAQAIVADGQQPSAAPWVRDVGDPLAALLAFQLGCDVDVADRGAFTFPGTDGAPNLLATEQAVWGVGLRAFPLDEVAWGPAPDPCAAPSSTSTSTSGAESAPPATPVAVAPVFTG
jgi:hypothetical protein